MATRLDYKVSVTPIQEVGDDTEGGGVKTDVIAFDWQKSAESIGKQEQDIQQKKLDEEKHIRDQEIQGEMDKRAAEEALGISKEAIDIYKEQAEFLSGKRYTNTDLQHYIAELFQPQLLVERAKENIRREVPMDDEFKQTASALYEMVDIQPGAQMASSKGTWWGAFNVVTFYFDHHRREAMQGGRLHSAWFGTGANTKVKALNKAIEYAKAA